MTERTEGFFIPAENIIKPINTADGNGHSTEIPKTDTVFEAPALQDTTKQKILDVKRRQLIKVYWMAELEEKRIKEGQKLNPLKQRKLIRNTIALDKGRKEQDEYAIDLAEYKIGDKYLSTATDIIKKTDTTIKELKIKMETGQLNSQEKNEMLGETAKDAMKIWNIGSHTKRLLVDIYEFAGYSEEEAEKLAKRTGWSAAATAVSLAGTNGASIYMAAQAWNADFLANQEYGVQVATALSTHAAVIGVSQMVSRSNLKWLRRHTWSELPNFASYIITNKIYPSDENKPSNLKKQAIWNDLAYWFASPNAYVEMGYFSLNFANPPAAVAANLAAAGILTLRLGAQEGALKAIKEYQQGNKKNLPK